MLALLEENCRSATAVPQKSSVSMLLFVFQEGQQHAVMLYTWRCCSRAIPQPKVDYPPTSVVDPGSGAFFDPWIRDPGWVKKNRIRVGDEQPGSYFREL